MYELICILLQNDSNCVPSSEGLRQGGTPGRKVPGHVQASPGTLCEARRAGTLVLAFSSSP